MKQNTAEMVHTLWNWLNIKDEPVLCDAIFVFGGATLAIPQKGLELYRKQYADLIIVNGNTGTFGNREWDKPEAEMFTDYLTNSGVDAAQILVQSESTSTLEDVQLGIPMLQKRKTINKLIIVSRPVHQRRAFATIQKQYPGIKHINCPCDEPIPEHLNDEDVRSIGTRCLQEYERLIKYAQQGDIVEQKIPAEIETIYNNLRQKLLS